MAALLTLAMIISQTVAAAGSSGDGKTPFIEVYKVIERWRLDENPHMGVILINAGKCPVEKRDRLVKEAVRAIDYLNGIIRWFANKYPKYSYLKKIKLSYVIWNSTRPPEKIRYGTMLICAPCPIDPRAGGCLSLIHI